MTITVRRLPPVRETYYLDEARSIPTAFLASSSPSVGYLGPAIRRQAGSRNCSGWALPVVCPEGDNLATYVAIEFLREHIGAGRWVIVVSQEGGSGSDAALWGYLQSVMAWEIGVVGAVISGYARDLDEINEKLGKEFAVFAWGGSPVRAACTPNGSVGVPVVINGVTVRAGDLIAGDCDGVVCVPRDQVDTVIDSSRSAIIHEVNCVQGVREGHSPVEVMKLDALLEGNVELEE